ncbi:DUF4293 domain-containing protein [Flavobacteriaceae bacterium]|jgi:hypothetical protein|nr:conserved hypothetical protein [Flavobacteria bacterium MS024-3C]KRO81391.1 MAG: hypothetical protein ABR91_02745 [Polaribacter sp. BACL8 MAG-120531-bin13]MBT5394775.1 DUF4293 domain-containing protein [Flavobacteriaceae bacterium]NQV63135.1 DUF4293 domain-containing protein [Cryomorphaceae bacterium]MBT5585528.1 DUF4293 domain-containing protein [Flavobacteriaceae bacterium]|tara:strand:+ start:2365 stop:2775 length:411 start_codon:yes stop_codon:yes gene_type:complete
MIQRIQSFYLFIVAAVNLFAVFFVNIVAEVSENTIFTLANALNKGTFILFVTLTLISVFSYKKRINQFVMNRLNIILNFFLLGFFVYRWLSLSGESFLSEKGIGMFVPIISIVFLSVANKAIKKDEDLVKSVDRLR